MEGQEEKKVKLEFRKSTLWKVSTVVLGILFIISIFTGGFWFGSDSDIGDGGPSFPTAAATVDIKSSYSRGSKDAEVTMVEFSDFQCPFCGRFFEQTLPLIESQYIKTGKVKFVYKDFPLDSIHPQATPAALAARCSGEQGKFWEYHDLIFQNQQLLGDSSYSQWAADLDLDIDKFNDCYDSKKYLKAVQQDFNEGNNAGVRGTPGFLINGKLVSGAQPFSVFQQVIEAELSS